MELSREKARWVILVFSVFLLFGSYYCFELPAAVKDSLELKFSNQLTNEEYEYFFNSLFSIYSLPNIILPFINGFLIDKIGLRGVLLGLVSLVTIGQIIFSFALTGQSLSLMVVGRFLFGIGSESLFVAENILLIKYFHGRELSFAIGVNLAVANLGGVLNMFLTPRLSANFGIEYAIWTGAGLCVFSLLCIILVLYLDSKMTNINSPSLINREEALPKEIKLQDFQVFGKTFWYLALTGFFLYSCIISWMNIGVSFLIDYWFQDAPVHEAEVSAGNCLSLMWLSAVISGPLIGCFVDKHGFRLKILCIGALLSTAAMASMFVIHPVIPVIILGFAYSFGVASIYPSVPYIVPKEFLGKGNGIVTSLQNLGFTIFPYVIATLKVNYGDYKYSQIFLIASTMMAIIFAFLTNRANNIENAMAPRIKRQDPEDIELKEFPESVDT